MISFIVIGKNEGWKLKKCFESIFKTVEYNKLINYEVIYVDSNSSDNSIEIAKSFKKIKIFKITDVYNAAIGRNIGAKESNGDVLFFIDGDMEIMPDFLPLVYSEKEGLNNDFVSGNWMNYYYDKDNNFISKFPYLNIDVDTIEKVTGGLFLIKSSIWNDIGGMRSVFKKSQDIDLGLRLAKKRIFLHRKKEIAANHHTISYLDKNRMWRDLFSWNHLYARSLLYRKNILNRYMYGRLFRNEYSIFLLLIIIINLLMEYKSILFLIVYFSIIIFKSLKKSQKEYYRIFENSIYFLLRDISVFIGVFIFFPTQHTNTTIKDVN